jgi:hypothetical protein
MKTRLIQILILSTVTLLCAGSLELRIPLTGLRGKSGACLVELLNPDNRVVGKTSRKVMLDRDTSIVSVKVAVDSNAGDYDLLRARVTLDTVRRVFAAPDLHDRLMVTILGDQEFIKGTNAAFRVIARTARGQAPLRDVLVKAFVMIKEKKSWVFEGSTDAAGLCIVAFKTPDAASATLTIEASSELGKDMCEAQLSFIDGSLTYLVTDKPIYQPGQTIHIRSLSLRKPALLPVKNREAVFEVEDGKGNKVFKKALMTGAFGTAYASFSLADELNFGNYTIRAIVGREKVEKTVKVERYVLPKFKVAVKTDKEYYLPAAKAEIDIDAQYFFGKPVAEAQVKVTVFKYDIGFQQEAILTGKTDGEGTYHLTYPLPSSFTGTPLENGDAFVRLGVEVTDKANHAEKMSLKKKIVKQMIGLNIIPEGGALKSGLENRVWVVARYPDAAPCMAEVTLDNNGAKQVAKTDSSGIAEFTLTPHESSVTLAATARDAKGETVSLSKDLIVNVSGDQVILRLTRTIFKAGEAAPMRLLTSRTSGRIFLDVVKDNQTMLTRSIEILNGAATFSLPLSADLAGSLWLHAYIVTPQSDIVRDSRLIYVNAANDLSIKVTPAKESFLPGEEGTIGFTVTDKVGKPAVAALCVAIVDEAVFSVSELQPGLEKVYFTLEKELLTPRYEIHGFEPAAIVGERAARPRAENALFATLTPKKPFAVNHVTALDVGEKLRTAFGPALDRIREKVLAAIRNYNARYNKYPESLDEKELVAEGFLNSGDLLDPWERPCRLSGDSYYPEAQSAGPDGVFDNADDLLSRQKMPKAEAMFMMDAVGQGMRGIRPMAPAAAGMAKQAMAFGGGAPSDKARPKGQGGPGEEPRVREFFPETFLFEPALITDVRGKATLTAVMPDAITTWRVTASASSAGGALGSVLAGVKVFQEFFVDIDLPVALTEGDEISIPVALSNYLPQKQKVTLNFRKEEWFEMLGDSVIVRELAKDEVAAVYFPIRVKKFGDHTMLVKAYGKVKSDAIKREIRVYPDGRKFERLVSDRLSAPVSTNITFPANAVPGAGSLFVRLYPGMFSQIVSGLDKMLGMPYGCFEQTSSVTFPNVLILDYLRQTAQVKPEIEMKAAEYISLGYQRLLSFEVDGGGFSWFGNAPANKILTAYGLMEFKSMAAVHEIDNRVLERTVAWLKREQRGDGAWLPDQNYLHAESWGRIQGSELLPTAYICWALGEIGDAGAATVNGLSYLRLHWQDAKDPYMLALVANAFVAADPRGPVTAEVLKKLVEIAKHEKDAIYWQSAIPSVTFSTGEGADVEASGLACYALLRSGTLSADAAKALTWLVRAKSADGMWHTTQGSIIALRCMLAALGGKAESADAVVSVTINGRSAGELRVDKSNCDVMQQLDLAEYSTADNTVEIGLKGEGNLMYEIAAGYYLRWSDVPPPPRPAFTIKADYDRTQLSVNDVVTVNVNVALVKEGVAQMVMVDVGVPPGFDVLTSTLEELVGKTIQKYSLTSRQVTIYLDEVAKAKPVNFSFSLKARYPIKAKAAPSRAWEYYNSSEEALRSPQEMKVMEKKERD